MKLGPLVWSTTRPARIIPAAHGPFLRYIGWSLRRHFRAVRLAHGGAAPEDSKYYPLVVYLNHASWWDPLLMLWLGKRLYPGRPQYGPMDAVELDRYGIFKALGVFGVEQGTIAGARSFLRNSAALLSEPGAMLWLTPQSRFADVRERPVRLASGIAHLAMRMPEAMFVPMALEYGFGNERLPEIHVCFGDALKGSALGGGPREILEALEARLESTQDRLAGLVRDRNLDAFELLLSGRGGTSLPYDLWRRVLAGLRGKKVVLEHSQIQ